MSFRAVFATVATAATMAACTLFAGLDGFTSTDDADAAGSDGLAPASGDAPSDTATRGDADAAVPGDGGRFCADFPGAALCDDFDDDSPLTRWNLATDPGTTLAIATDNVRSAPHAVRATVTPSSVPRSVSISRSVPGVVSHARLTYALYVEARPANSEVEVNILRFLCGSSCTSDVYLAVTATGANIVEQFYDADGGNGNEHTLGTSIPTGKWVRVELEVVLSGARTLALSVDGALITTKALTLIGPGTPRVYAGITYANKAAPSASVLVDDVLFEVLP